MIHVSPSVRFSLGMVLITISVLLLGNLVGLIPNQSIVIMEARKNTVESLAVQCTMAARDNNVATIKKTMNAILTSHPEIISLGMLSFDGEYYTKTKDHQTLWVAPFGEDSTSTHWQVPIHQGSKRWGTLEISFTPPAIGLMFFGYHFSPFALLLIFSSVVSFIGSFIFTKRTLRHLDPTSVMPGRVKHALDTLTEGVVLVDTKERIILANSAFAKKLGCSVESLMGSKASQLGWQAPETSNSPAELPWIRAISQGKSQSDIPLKLATKYDGPITFMANGAPILDDKGKSRGALATFNDVTEMENKNSQLSETLEILQKSQDEVQLKNKELEILATQDPLTGCLNRRAFFEKTGKHLASIKTGGSNLACIMTDIDLFKSVNDNYGHGIGDQVIIYFANQLLSAAEGNDTVCRYGGEEFCIVLPNCDIAGANVIAERLRQKIFMQGPNAIPDVPGMKIAGSFGVSDLSFGADSIEELINQADSALYMAKETGRNRVVCWEENLNENNELQATGD